MIDGNVRLILGDDKGRMSDPELCLDHVFCTSPMEFARQSHGEVIAACMESGALTMVRSDDIRELTSVKNVAILAMRRRGLFNGCALGRFDIHVDGDEPISFDAAIRLIGLLLMQHSREEQVFVAFALHVAQQDGYGGFIDPHFHVLWERRGRDADDMRSFIAAEFVS